MPETKIALGLAAQIIGRRLGAPAIRRRIAHVVGYFCANGLEERAIPRVFF